MSLTVEDLRGMVERLNSQEVLPIANRLLIIHAKHHRMLRRLKPRYAAKRSWQRGAR